MHSPTVAGESLAWISESWSGWNWRPRSTSGRQNQPAVAALHPLVVGEGEHGAVAERVAVDGGDGRHGCRQDAAEQRDRAVDELLQPIAHAAERLEVVALRVRLAVTDGHQRGRRLVGVDRVERGLEPAEQILVHGVGAVAQVDDVDAASRISVVVIGAAARLGSG